MIPLVGCPVEISSGQRAGTKGTILVVRSARDILASLGPNADAYVKQQAAMLGAGWRDIVFSAFVSLEDGSAIHGNHITLKILDPAQTRSKRYHGPG